MTNTVQSINGQSLFDLNMQVYGSLDNLVAFCIGNGLSSLNYIPLVPKTFSYNTNLVSDGKTNNYVYVTAIPPQFYITEDGSEYYETEDGGSGYAVE